MEERWINKKKDAERKDGRDDNKEGKKTNKVKA
jgi:hypothetical protein